MKPAMFLAALLSLAACTKTVNVTSSTAAATASNLPATISTEAPSPSPTQEAPVKQAGYGIKTCDIAVIGIAGGNNSLMVGSTLIKNSGAVDLSVKVDFAWLFADGSKLSAPSKTVQVPVGASRAVLFHALANQDQVSLFEAMPAYVHDTGALKDGKLCKTTAAFK